MESKTTAVIIGRFQVPYLHLGHIYLISHALQNYDKVVILLGCIDPKNGETDERNPYSIHYRLMVIDKVFPHVEVVYLYDKPGDDKKWSKQVDMLIEDYENPVLLHSRDSFVDHYMGRYPTKEVPELPGYSGTELRKQFSHAGVSKKGTGPGTTLNLDKL